jgi:hypothetical protein
MYLVADLCPCTLPTAASPSNTSLTLLLGFGCADASAIVMLWMLRRGICDECYQEWATIQIVSNGLETWFDGGIMIWVERGGRVALGRLRGGGVPRAVTELSHVMLR